MAAAAAPRLPLTIPAPVREGAPSQRFSTLWTVVTWAPGIPLDHTSHHPRRARHPDRGSLPEGPARASAARRTSWQQHPRDRTRGFEQFLVAMDAGAIGPDAAGLEAVWRDAVAAAACTSAPVWAHGDLRPANVVIADATLAGVVDFGDLCVGDPAVDLAAGWVLLPAGAANRFFAAYAQATVRRARGHAALKAVFLMLMCQDGERGIPGGKPA